MSSMEKQSFDVRIKVHDLYLIILWDTSYFEPRPNDKRICGKRVAESLFSIEAFASNSKPEYRIAQALADKLRPELGKQIKLVEDQLKESQELVSAELNDPLIKAVDVTMPEHSEYFLSVEKGKGAPLVNSFIRLFVLADNITASLKDLHYRGAISKSDYKKREDQYAKPLRKLMNDMNIIIKRYHQQRKAITAK
jgi:hypothetical protein